MKLDLKMDINTLLFLVFLLLILFAWGALIISGITDSPLISVYKNCTCPDPFPISYWNHYEDIEEEKPDINWTKFKQWNDKRFNITNYNYSDLPDFSKCKQVRCDCMDWGCMAYCMECPE